MKRIVAALPIAVAAAAVAAPAVSSASSTPVVNKQPTNFELKLDDHDCPFAATSADV